MKENRKGLHTTSRLTAHIVWVTKYRLPRFARRHQNQMPGLARTSLWCWRCADIERCRIKRPRSYAHRVSAETCIIGIAQTLERTILKTLAARVSKTSGAILGTTLLGGGLWSVVNRQYYRRDGARILRASSAQIKQGSGQFHPWRLTMKDFQSIFKPLHLQCRVV